MSAPDDERILNAASTLAEIIGREPDRQKRAEANYWLICQNRSTQLLAIRVKALENYLLRQGIDPDSISPLIKEEDYEDSSGT